ncbi:hypothetical protein PTKIN_Ptkin15bG0023100 [Pterospermum kingtungense]
MATDPRDSNIVDFKNFCAAATCEGWTVFKQRQCQSTGRVLKPDFQQAFCKKELKSLGGTSQPACFLWNPTFLEKINLPDLPWSHNTRYIKCILTAAPKEPRCWVVFLIENQPLVLFCRPGDKKWIPCWYAKYEKVEFDHILHDAITCDGKLYGFNSRMGNMSQLVLGLGHHELQFKSYSSWLPLNSSLKKEQLVDSCGQVFVVRRKSMLDISVYTMDFSQNKWEKVSDLGCDRNFVLIGDYSTSFSSTEVGFGAGNTIYFTEKDDNESLYSFHLADESLSVWRNHPDSGTLWVVHDEMLSELRVPDEPTSGYKQIIDEYEKIDEDDQTIEESRECISDDENKSESMMVWFQLPADVLRYIAQHLTVSDHMNLRATCKNWRSLVPPIQWKPNQGGIPFNYPWLMFSRGEKGMYSFYDPMCNLMHSISIPELEDCEVRYSNKGWLLVTKAPRSIFFFEPFTRTKIQLPDLREDIWFEGICFSDPPTSSNWQIFGIGHIYQASMNVLYLRSTDQDWVHHGINSETLPDPSFTNPVFDGESFSYLGRNGSLIFFNLTEAGLDWFVESSSSRTLHSSRRFLVCYENELISLFLDRMGKWIRVFKLDRRVRKWLEIKSMKNEILFLSQTTCLGVEATNQNIRNTIQFSVFSDIVEDDCSNISYSFKHRKYQIYRRGRVYSSVSDLYDSKEFLRGTWIQPLVVPKMMTTAAV